jgi:hypothetical protein
MVQWKESKSLLQDVDRFPEFAERFLRIQPKEGGRTIPFKLNKVQDWFFRTFIAPTWRADKPVRIAILKARQEGFSTLAQGFNLWVTLGRPNTNNLVIARDEEQTKMLFRMIKRFDENLPIGGILPIFPKAMCTKKGIEYKKPPLGKFPKKMIGRNDLVFLDSRIEIRSAMDDENLGRSGTFQCVHASEVAFWKNLTGALSSLMAACSAEPKSAIFLESTANGFNSWHSFWSNLTIGEQEVPTNWQRVFVPWFWDSRYELPLNIKRFFADDTEEELYAQIRDDPTLPEMDPEVTIDRIWYKLFWRRQTIRDMFFGDLLKFKQEFPASDVEAFIFDGASAFQSTALTRMERHTRKPLVRAHIRLVPPKETPEKPQGGRTTRVNHPIPELEEHERGRLLIYEMPQPGQKFAIFGDAAEGKASESFGTADEMKSKFDFSAASVLRVDDYPPAIRQVAIWHGTVDPDLFGDILVAMGWLFNEAFLGWEINGPGRSLSIQVIERHRYTNVFMREDLDSITHRPTQKPGWRTTPGTKPDMVATGQRYVREKTLLILDSATLLEMKAFSRVGQNRFEAAEGHDDRVITILGGLTIVEPRLEAIRRQIQAEKKVVAAKSSEIDPDRDLFEPKDKPHPILGSEW